jgi:hypothetical protein
LERRTRFPGDTVRIDAALDYPAIHATAPNELIFHLNYLLARGSISNPATIGNPLQRAATLTHDGWAKLGGSGGSSRIAFVATSFDPSLDDAFTHGIEPAIRSAEYEPLRVDRVQHNQKFAIALSLKFAGRILWLLT